MYFRPFIGVPYHTIYHDRLGPHNCRSTVCKIFWGIGPFGLVFVGEHHFTPPQTNWWLLKTLKITHQKWWKGTSSEPSSSMTLGFHMFHVFFCWELYLHKRSSEQEDWHIFEGFQDLKADICCLFPLANTHQVRMLGRKQQLDQKLVASILANTLAQTVDPCFLLTLIFFQVKCKK